VPHGVPFARAGGSLEWHLDPRILSYSPGCCLLA